jgi:hypothetical protein
MSQQALNSEHAVESAFREHAQQFHCEAFSMGRADLPEKRDPRKETYWILGDYSWCGRSFHFAGPLVQPPRISSIMLVGTLKDPLRPGDSAEWASLAGSFAEFGLTMGLGAPSDIVVGGSLELCTLNINKILINWATRFVHQGLESIESRCTASTANQHSVSFS